MDLNEALKKMLEAAEAVLAFEPTRDRPHVSALTVEALATYALSLDHWMRNQGFLPSEWARGRS